MKEEFNMDKSFREKLEGFSVHPPAHVWDGIQGQMAAMRRKKRMVYFAWISAAAVVLLAFVAGWYFNNSKNEILPVIVEREIVEPIQNEISEQNNRTNLLGENDMKLNEEENKTEQQILNNSHLNQSATSLLVAENRQVEDKNLENTTINSFDRISLEMLERIEALFKPEKSETQLGFIRQKKIPIDLNEFEENLIAENARILSKSIEKETGWILGMNVSPGYSSHQVSHSDSYSQNMTYSGTNGNGNVGGGFSVQYKTNKKLKIESGVYYAQNGQKSDNSLELFAFNGQADLAFSAPEKSFFNNTVNVSNGELQMNSTAGVIAFNGTPKGAEISSDFDASRTNFSNSLVSTGEFSQVFDFIEIPLYLRYNIIDSKIGIELMGGLNAGLIIGNNAFIDNEYGLQKIGKTQDISSVNISGTLGLGVNCEIGKNLSMAVEPRINYYLNSINKNPAVDFRPYRIGVFTGLYYEF